MRDEAPGAVPTVVGIGASAGGLMEARTDRRPLHVFGTDIDLPALLHARRGAYGPDALDALTDARHERFFAPEAGRFRATPRLREVCVLAPHNLIEDPPLSRLDLISCRNLMIHLSGELQGRVIPRFHFALREKGHLFLGLAEGLAGDEALFRPLDRPNRVFQRDDRAPRAARRSTSVRGAPRRSARSFPAARRRRASSCRARGRPSRRSCAGTRRPSPWSSPPARCSTSRRP